MKIYSLEKCKKKGSDLSETFIIEPFDHGQALTFGNAIRRTLLSETCGFAITQVQINEIENEFEQTAFLREDTMEILLNLKQIFLKPTKLFSKKFQKKNVEYKNITKIKGPLIVTAGMLNIPKEFLVINPNQYICTILDNCELKLTLTISYDKAYRLIDDSKKENFFEKTFKNEGFVLDLDSFFVPVKKVNYKIKTIRDTFGNLKESLIIEIVTNGTITPKKAFLESINACLKNFYNIFVNTLNLKTLKKNIK